MGLDGAVVLVTGASGALGGAIARECAAAGATVAAHYRSNAERAQAVVASLAPGDHLAVAADLAEPEAVRAMVA